MTKEEIRDIVISYTNRSDKTTVIDTAIDFALTTLAQTNLFDDAKREFNCPTSATVSSVFLPAKLNQLLDVRLIDPSSPTLSYPLVLLRKLEFVAKFPNVPQNSVTGRPYWCYRDKNVLYFHCITQAAYTFRMTGYFLPTFFLDTDENPILDSDEAIAAYATANVYESLEMFDAHDRWLGKWKMLAKNLIDSKQRELGIKFVATPWQRNAPSEVNAPWLDPFVERSTSR